MEKEVFIECGAWLNFAHLEDSLSLDELLVLFDTTAEKFKRNAEIMGAAMGAIPGSGPSGSKNDMQINDGKDLAQLPFGVGHTTIEKEK